MFKKLAVQYYEEDCDGKRFRKLCEKAEHCWEKAELQLSEETVEGLQRRMRLHDWCISDLSVRCEWGANQCQISLKKREDRCKLLFSNVRSLSFFGELVSPSANYPGFFDGDSFARILEIWLDYRKRFECCLLLDSERYIVIKAESMTLSE